MSLFAAAETGDVHTLRRLLSGKNNPNQQDIDGVREKERERIWRGREKKGERERKSTNLLLLLHLNIFVFAHFPSQAVWNFIIYVYRLCVY
jgi:hypothetical protein